MGVQVVKLIGTPVTITNASNVFSDGEGDPSSVYSNTAADGTSEYAARRDHTHALDITSLTEDASPVASTDYIITYDASATTNKKVKIQNIQSAGSLTESLAIAYAVAL